MEKAAVKFWISAKVWGIKFEIYIGFIGEPLTLVSNVKEIPKDATIIWYDFENATDEENEYLKNLPYHQILICKMRLFY